MNGICNTCERTINTNDYFILGGHIYHTGCGSVGHGIPPVPSFETDLFQLIEKHFKPLEIPNIRKGDLYRSLSQLDRRTCLKRILANMVFTDTVVDSVEAWVDGNTWTTPAFECTYTEELDEVMPYVMAIDAVYQRDTIRPTTDKDGESIWYFGNGRVRLKATPSSCEYVVIGQEMTPVYKTLCGSALDAYKKAIAPVDDSVQLYATNN